MYPGSSFAGAVRQGMKHLCKRNVTYDSGCKLHKQAPENGTVTTDFGKLHTISDYLLKKMAERNDATVTIQFEYKNQKLQITFPAGTDYTPVLTDTDTMYGFYGVASKLGLTVTERQ